MHRFKKKSNSGFTLLEIVLVVAIISIGAAVSFFSINGMIPDMRLSAAARDLKSDLNLAKLRAIRENEPISILFFSPDANSYTIYFDKDGDGAPGAGDTIVKTMSMPNKVSITAAAFGGGPSIAFDPRGLALAGGTASLTNTRGKLRNVNLSLTGRVNIITP